MKQQRSEDGEMSAWHHVLIPLLVVITLAVFWPVQRYSFIRYDDDAYIYENPHVSTGLTAANVRWALTAVHSYNWHPLTWISHMLDAQVYGLDPGGHHRTNLLFHLANVVLLYLVLKRITGFGWRSGLVAALFAVHPLHVESVAWAAERKDLLSTYLMLLTIGAYAWYARHPSLRRYLPVLLLYVLGLMSKPMLVTLPLVLLLLDFWPLARLRPGANASWKLIAEKLPLLMLAGISGIITLAAQGSGGAMARPMAYSLGFRFADAAIAYARYIGKMFWPEGLATPYPYPSPHFPVWESMGAGLLLALASAAALSLARRRPYLAMGWLWYLVTLLPVMGLVQAGVQPQADRYTYITLIGLFIIVAWGVPDLLAWMTSRLGKRAAKPSALRFASPALFSVAILGLALCARTQVGYWRDGITLFSHALDVTRDNYLAHNGLGVAYVDGGDSARAAAEFRTAIKIAPDYARPHYNLGNELVKAGKVDEAITEFRKAIDLTPSDARAYHNLGYALDAAGKMNEATDAYREAVRLQPQSGESHNNLAVHLYAAGQYAEAWKEVRLAQQCGFQPLPNFLRALSAKMPEPAKTPDN